MKKIISVILALAMVLALAAPAANAAEDKCSCGINPTIYVGPLGNTDIYENPDSENERILFRPETNTILGIVGKILPSLFLLPILKNYDMFGTALIDAVNDAMGAMALDGNGNSASNVSVKLEKPKGSDHGINKDYYFHYDWRLDPVEVASQLKEFVEEVKKLTRHDTVNFRASSMGGVVAMSYFNEYGYDDVDVCIFQCCPILGTAVAGDLLCRKLKLDGKALLDYGTGAFPVVDGGSFALNLLFNGLYYSGLIDVVMKAGDNILGNLQTRVFDELMTPVFGTLLGLWAFVPDASYEEAKRINLDSETQAGLIAKADYYHYNIQCRAEEILKGAINDGTRIMIVAGYDIQRTPLVESITSDSDGTVDTKYASAGATVAERGTTLGEGYVQRVQDGHNHISPDGRIDASTCILPEYTWFIKGMLHANCHDGIRELYNWFAYSDEDLTVFSNPKFTQFLQNDKPNLRVIALGNFAPGATAPIYEKIDSVYTDKIAPAMDKFFGFLDKIKR